LEAALNITKILKLLPHRFPFLLVDKVISRHDGPDRKCRVGFKIVAVKNVTFNEPFFPGHFPDFPIMPGVLQIEALAQAACLAYIREDDPEMDFFIASIKDARFRKPVVPGDTVVLHAEVIKDRGSIIVINAEAKVDGQTVCEAEILAKIGLKSKRDA
jgi:beta-hydroxyacyl-ACP dehydratase FabZ